MHKTMDAIEAIFTRKSIPKLKPDPVPREVIERLLEAAVQAPNHYKVRPWRFIVLTGAARERLGEIFADILREKFPDLPESAYEKERRKPLRAPVLIVAAAALPGSPKEILTENICATAAAVQNLLLAAHALGLAAKWRTGTPASEPRVKEFLGLSPEQPLISFIYLGYPAFEPAPPNRPSHHDRVTWMT